MEYNKYMKTLCNFRLGLLIMIFLTCFVGNLVAKGASDSAVDPVQLIKTELKAGLDEKQAFEKVVAEYGSVIETQKGKNFIFTFLFYNEGGIIDEEIILHTNLLPQSSLQTMSMIKGTQIYYTDVKVKEKPDYITYAFQASAIFLSDQYNPYVWSDGRKSSYIRVAENTGAIAVAKDFYPKGKYEVLSNRINYIYLPAAYFANPDQEFPVIYMLDAQNIWDNKDCAWNGWKVDTIMEKLVAEGKMEPCIIAGISNSSQRTHEYAGWCRELPPGESRGGSKNYTQHFSEHEAMILDDFIPYVEANYRVKTGKENRAIVGSSYGAFYGAYMITRHPDVFGKAGLFSGGSTGYTEIIADDLVKDSSVQIYLDCGAGDGLETTLLPGTEAFLEYLKTKGYVEEENLMYRFVANHSHNERCWAERLPDCLDFLF